jgi:hypothetical protein
MAAVNPDLINFLHVSALINPSSTAEVPFLPLKPQPLSVAKAVENESRATKDAAIFYLPEHEVCRIPFSISSLAKVLNSAIKKSGW